jgi:hypothetical protein
MNPWHVIRKFGTRLTSYPVFVYFCGSTSQIQIRGKKGFPRLIGETEKKEEERHVHEVNRGFRTEDGIFRRSSKGSR